ncbi:hypothetical protein PTKIN_Ptkin01aG0315200 [Pterospermum kingtungense]
MAARKAQKEKENKGARTKRGAGASQPSKYKGGIGHSQTSKRKSPAMKNAAQEVAYALVALSAAAKDVASTQSAKTSMGVEARKESTTLVEQVVPKKKRSENTVSTPKEQPAGKRSRVETIASTGNSNENGLVLPRPMYGQEVPRKKDAARPDPNSDSLLMNPRYGLKFSRSSIPLQDHQYLMETPFLQNFDGLEADVARVLCRTQAIGDQAIVLVKDLKHELNEEKVLRAAAEARAGAAELKVKDLEGELERLRAETNDQLSAAAEAKEKEIKDAVEKALKDANYDLFPKVWKYVWAVEVKFKGLEGELERLRAKSNDQLSTATEATEKERKDAVEKTLKDARYDLVSKALEYDNWDLSDLDFDLLDRYDTAADALIREEEEGEEANGSEARAGATEAKEKEIKDAVEKALKDAGFDLVLKAYNYGIPYRKSALYMIEVRHPDWDLSDINFDQLEGYDEAVDALMREEEVAKEAKDNKARAGAAQVKVKGLGELVRLRAETYDQLSAAADSKEKEVKEALEKAVKHAHDQVDSDARKYGMAFRKSALHMIKVRHPDWELSDIDFDLLEGYDKEAGAIMRNKEEVEEANGSKVVKENLTTVKVANAENVKEMFQLFLKMLPK